MFQCGRIRLKHGSNATLVLVIDNRIMLKERVIPFYKQYVNPFGTEAKTIRIVKFELLLSYIEQGAHRNLNALINEMLPIWDDLRMQRGQRNQTFATSDSRVSSLGSPSGDTLYEAIEYVRAHK